MVVIYDDDPRHDDNHDQRKMSIHCIGSFQECDAWVTKTSTVLKTIMLKFKLNEEFDDTTPDGRQVSKLIFKISKLVVEIMMESTP